MSFTNLNFYKYGANMTIPVQIVSNLDQSELNHSDAAEVCADVYERHQNLQDTSNLSEAVAYMRRPALSVYLKVWATYANKYKVPFDHPFASEYYFYASTLEVLDAYTSCNEPSFTKRLFSNGCRELSDSTVLQSQKDALTEHLHLLNELYVEDLNGKQGLRAGTQEMQSLYITEFSKMIDNFDLLLKD